MSIGYLEKHHSEIINYEGRRKVGKSIGSGRIEKGLTWEDLLQIRLLC